MAQYNLAWMYEDGVGVTADDAKAFKWFLRSAEGGDPDAQYEVVQRYATGQGTEPDLVAAYTWALVMDERDVDGAGDLAGALGEELSDEQRSSAHAHAGELIGDGG